MASSGNFRFGPRFLVLFTLQAVMASAAMAHPAGAAESKSARPAAAQKTPPADPWVVSCLGAADASGLQCQASENLTELKTGQRVLTVTIRKESGDKGGYAMLLALPHGLFLPAGITYQVDAGPRSTAPVETSDRNGAYAAVPLSAGMIAAMKTGTKLDVGMESVTRKKVVIPVSLAGFRAAIGKLQAIR